MAQKSKTAAKMFCSWEEGTMVGVKSYPISTKCLWKGSPCRSPPVPSASFKYDFRSESTADASVAHIHSLWSSSPGKRQFLDLLKGISAK